MQVFLKLIQMVTWSMGERKLWWNCSKQSREVGWRILRKHRLVNLYSWTWTRPAFSSKRFQEDYFIATFYFQNCWGYWLFDPRMFTRCSSYSAQRNQVKHMSLGPKEPSEKMILSAKLNLMINNQVYGLRPGDKQPSSISLTWLRVTEYTFILWLSMPAISKLINPIN